MLLATASQAAFDRSSSGRMTTWLRTPTRPFSRRQPQNFSLPFFFAIALPFFFEFFAMSLTFQRVSRAQRSAKRCAAEPGPRLGRKLGPGSAVHHFVLRRARDKKVITTAWS